MTASRTSGRLANISMNPLISEQWLWLAKSLDFLFGVDSWPPPTIYLMNSKLIALWIQSFYYSTHILSSSSAVFYLILIALYEYNPSRVLGDVIHHSIGVFSMNSYIYLLLLSFFNLVSVSFNEFKCVFTHYFALINSNLVYSNIVSYAEVYELRSYYISL